MARRNRIVMYALPAIAVVALALAVRSIGRSNANPTPMAIAATTTLSTRAIAGSGLVEPAGRLVSVSAPVAGIVREVRVRPGETVAAGDILFALDDALANASVDQRRRDLTAAEARLRQTVARKAQLLAEAAAAQGALEAAQADRDEAGELVQTGTQLVGGAVSQRELSRRRNALRSAESRLAEARARLDGALAAVALVDPDQAGATFSVDRAAVEQARAALAVAEADRGRLEIRAPRDGTVLAVEIRPGEFVNPGSSMAPVALGLLAPLHVRVDIDEADLPRLATGSAATAARRGAGDERIPLGFLRAEPLLQPKRSLSGGLDERVDTRVLQLIYEVQRTELDLRPGQLLDVTIELGGRSALTGR